MKHVSMRFVAALALPLALAGCFEGEPSATAIGDAFRRQIDAEKEAALRMAGNNPMAREMMQAFAIEVAGVEKMGCAADAARAYLCDVRLTIKHNQSGTEHSAVSRLRLVQSSDGWAIGF